tara:strand:- start:9683 stop:10534 length:852 start_codon:yes stop_codon:yes gene_type:complete
MKILVTGGAGQLGLAFKRQPHLKNLIVLDRGHLDITDNSQIEKVLKEELPEVVVNCAAWTDVDGCEENPDRAMTTNGHAVGYLAESAKEIGAKVVQISTDYVFDGHKETPYVETDLPNPLSVYGESKLLGENLAGSDALTIRTSWVVSLDGKNMLRTILNLLESNDDLYFVDDQIGCPTFTDDLAKTILLLIDKQVSGVFHVTNTDSVSWYGFAHEVSNIVGADTRRLHPIPTTELRPQRAAPRPRNSVLENRNLSNIGVSPLPPFSMSLKNSLEKFLHDERN